MNTFFLLWWTFPLLAYGANRVRARKIQEAEAKAEAKRGQRAQQGGWPFGAKQKPPPDQDGPVIDAQWVSLDSGDSR